ncbi:MAG TPA: sulfide dehydrogenase [Thiobacillaceae bacterium]|nr:sulfide dehydrogenase [Thiobacillaceae bacterium]
MNMKPILRLGLLAGLAGIGPAMAAGGPDGSLHLKVIAATCNNCHGPDGQSLGAVPSLAGQDRDYLRQAMMECKTGKRETTVMLKYMMGYTDDEIAQLADHFANLK